MGHAVSRALHAGRVGTAWATFALLVPVLVTAPARAQSSRLERQVKAAFLYKFAGYAEWPANAFPNPGTPVRIGVAGDEALAEELRRIVDGRTSGGRVVEVVSMNADLPPAEVHLAYYGGPAGAPLDEWLRGAGVEPVLLVTASPGALRRGSMINLVLRDVRVRFEVGLGAAERAGITLSSRLLSVAQAVITRTP